MKSNLDIYEKRKMNNPLTVLEIIYHGNNKYTFRLIRPPHSQAKTTQKASDKININRKNIIKQCQEIKERIQYFNEHPLNEGDEHYSSITTLGQTLYNQFVIPADLKKQLINLHSPILISTAVPDICWEMFNDGDEFWGVKYSISRSLWLPHDIVYDEDILIRVPWRRGGKNALIIASDPKGDIPNVVKETERLLKWLEEKGIDYYYLSPKEATCLGVITEIEKGNYDIIHYAGHVNHSSKKDVIILNDGTISSLEIERSAKPCKIVFLSCCESAVGTRSFANAFLKKGAQIIIGSICKVHDKGSREFAEKFYELIFQGEKVGQSLKSARTHLIKKPEAGASWASFIMYGDPRLQFVEEEIDLLEILIPYIAKNFEKINQEMKRFAPTKEYHLIDVIIDAFPNLTYEISILNNKEIYEIYNSYEQLISSIDEKRFGISYEDNKIFLTMHIPVKVATYSGLNLPPCELKIR